MLASDLLRLGLQQWNILRHGSGKGVMAGIPAVLLLIKTDQWEIYNPQEIKTVGGYRELALSFKNIRAVEANLSQDFACRQPLVGREQNQIAFLDCHSF